MRKLLILVVIVILLLLSAASLSTPGSESVPGASPDRGLYIYEAYCLACHGSNGSGDGPMAARLKRDFGVRPSDLSAPTFHRDRNDEQLKAAIVGGGAAVHRTPYMPAWGATLSSRQVDDLVAYIRELKDNPRPDSAPTLAVGEQLELGKAIYSIHCLACHGSRGDGDGPFLEGLRQTGSALVDPPRFSEREALAGHSNQALEKIIRKGLGHSGLSGREGSWWHRQMEANEIDALIFYLRALPLAQPGAEKA